MANIDVWPRPGQTFPDANNVPITSVGATVAESAYILNAIDDGYLLTTDPLGIFDPEDRSDLGPNAPSNAGYVTVGTTTSLSNERVLTAGTGISITDGGANGPVTVALSGGASAPATAQFVTLALDGTLTDERVLTAGTGISITDGGANGPVTVSAPATSARYVTLALDDTLTDERVLTAGAGISITDGGANGPVTVALTTTPAPATPSFVTLALDATLTNERVLTAGTGISIADGGANGNVTVSATGAPATPSFVTLALDGTLTNERVLTAGTGVTITDGGAGAAVTVATPNAVQGPVSATDNAAVRFDGTTGKLVQNSGVIIDDSNNITGVASITSTSATVNGNITVTGTVDGVDVSALAAVPYVTIGNSATTSAERALTAGTGITITDGGANNTVTVAAANGGLMTHPYKFDVQGTGQAIPSTAVTVLTMGTENFDPNNNFAANVYTVPVTGYYQIDAFLQLVASTANNPVLRLTINGVATEGRHAWVGSNAATQYLCYISRLFLFTAGQTIGLTVELSAGTASNLITRMNGHLLSS